MSIDDLPARTANWTVPTANVEKVRARLKRNVEEGYFAGVVACAVQRGKLLHFDSYGVQDHETQTPMAPDSIFRIASSTKPIIGVAMMTLYEEGKWRLDDPLHKHIPEFKGLKVARKDGALEEQLAPMTMAQIMSHTAGFPRGFAPDPNAKEPATPGGFRWPRDMQTMIDNFARTPLAFQPGKKWVYGPSVDIQGYLVEKLSGKPLDVYLKERVFGPLGMKDTDFCVAADATNRVASTYKYEGGKLERISKPSAEQIVKRPSFQSGGGGLWSTAEDYRRFCQMLQNEGAFEGQRVLKPETVRLMRQDVLEPQVYVSAVQGYVMPGARFGMDFMVITEPKGDTAMYGRDTYSWGGAFGTYFWVDPTNDFFALGMVQIQDGGAQHLGAKKEYPDLKLDSARLFYTGALT